MAIERLVQCAGSTRSFQIISTLLIATALIGLMCLPNLLPLPISERSNIVATTSWPPRTPVPPPGVDADHHILPMTSLISRQNYARMVEIYNMTRNMRFGPRGPDGTKFAIDYPSLRTSRNQPNCTHVPSGYCKLPESCCGKSCVNMTNDPDNCGHCSRVCKWDRACCNGKCRRLSTDAKNCGTCGAKCASGVKCIFGLCSY